MAKKHLPRAGYCSGLRGEALCGRYADYGTADHALLYTLARQAIRDNDVEWYCKQCLRHIQDTTTTTQPAE